MGTAQRTRWPSRASAQHSSRLNVLMPPRPERHSVAIVRIERGRKVTEPILRSLSASSRHDSLIARPARRGRVPLRYLRVRVRRSTEGRSGPPMMEGLPSPNASSPSGGAHTGAPSVESRVRARRRRRRVPHQRDAGVAIVWRRAWNRKCFTLARALEVKSRFVCRSSSRVHHATLCFETGLAWSRRGRMAW